MILNYNGVNHLDRCLASLGKTDYPDFSIQVIDNASDDESVGLIRSSYPHVEVMENKANLGYGMAYDKAIRMYEGEYFVLLNNDTEVDPGWLKPLVMRMRLDDSLAAVSSRLFFQEHPNVVNHAGGGMNYIGIAYDIGIFEPEQDCPSESVRRVLFPSGAACLMRKSAYCDAGGFDRKMFMYHEDVDLGWRLNIKGYKVECLPQSKVYHAFGGSSLEEKGMSFRNNLGYRHAMRSLMKNYGLSELFRSLPLLISLGARSRFRDGSIDFEKCLLWNLRHLPTTFLERSRIQKQRKKTDEQLKSLIWPYLSIPAFFPDYTLQTLDTFQNSQTQKNPSIEIGAQSPACLGYGWHGRERMEFLNASCRWTKSEAVLFLHSESARSGIVLQVAALAGTLGRKRQFDFTINGVDAGSEIIESDDIQYIELEYAGGPGAIELKIVCRDTWVPHKVFRNNDHRVMGIGVARASICPLSTDHRPFDGISLIIPTYNRISKLVRVLEALEGQTLSREKFEVIVVDDGSTDSTAQEVGRFAEKTQINLKYLRQKNMKQGAARNNGLRKAVMPLVAFIGDDIIPASNFLEKHLKRHNQENCHGKLVVIGHTMWPEHVRVTPFMHFVHEYGYQFGFSIMEDGGNLPFNFFYTSNISLSRDFLEQQEKVFCEDFGKFGWEDIELGFRLQENGMRLCFEPGATACHDHPVTVRDSCRRQLDLGRTSRTFLKKHPQLKSFLGNEQYLEKCSTLRLPAMLLSYVVDFLDQKKVKLPGILYKFILHTHYCAGAVIWNED
ncbi:glycosyltransferase family 2 protein [Desulfonatronovibrio magnus]|uniref:glycosyltransferase family 2 protein n=1 Tax=Desulfonatronovibrio magnus TaxID=698827 RepID=UPI0005EAD7A7|nr:glycosyltransferase [Desulfonatronovibrio magnus]